MIDRLARFTGPTGLRRSVIILTIALVVALALLQAVNLWSRYNETVNDTRTKASELSYILAEHMQSSVAAVDASLKQLVLHTVLAVANGIEALALHHQNEDRIQLIVTDVVMPGMGGRELAERIAAVDPKLRVLYMSGYTDDAVVLHGVGKGMNFIQKPFSPDLLAQKVREVLDNNPTLK